MQVIDFLFGSAKVENTNLVLGEIALVLIVFILAVIVPLILNKIIKNPKPGMRLLRSLCKTIAYTGLVVLLVLFLRFEGIYPFESRAWTTVAILGGIIAAIIVMLRFRRVAPSLVVDTARYEKYDQYLPKQKKK